MFAFAQPWMLWGLLAAAIPLIIHLFFRRRYQVTSWAAMRFLLAASKKHARRLKWEQWLLLFVRTMAIVLLVAAFARPSGQEFGPLFPEETPTQRVLVLDTSLSMSSRVGNNTPFSRVQSLAYQIIESSRPGDSVQIVRTAGQPRVLVRQQGFLREEIVGEIDRLTVSDEPGSWGQSLEEALGLLDAAPQFQQKEVYLLSDFQQSNWKPASDNAANSLRGLCQKLGEQAEVVCLDAGPEQSRVPNLAITELRTQDELVTTEQPVRFAATVKNWAETPTDNVVVELAINGRLTDSKTLQLTAGGETTAEFQHQFAKAGSHTVEARLSDDVLAADNRRWHIVDCRDELPVLMVNGKISGERKQQATYFAELALAPRFGETGLPVRDWIQPHVIRDGELTATDLSRYACIVVANVATMTDREVDILERYVAGGRGLILALGDQVVPEAYNDILYRDGKGILPAKLGERKGNISDAPSMFAFDPVGYEHPLLKVFAGNPDAGLETSRASMYYQFEAPLPASSRIALKFDTGDPMIIESRRGRGKVLLVTTSLDRTWGTWVLWPSFPPLMNELVKYAVSGGDDQRHLTAGEPLVWPIFQLGASAQSVTLKRPDGEIETVAPQSAEPLENSDSANAIVYEKTDKLGIYEMLGATTDGSPVNFAVHPPAPESDLTYLDQRSLEKDLFADARMRYQTEYRPLTRTFSTVAAPPAALPKILLWIVLLCLIAEPVLAWRFQHGVSLMILFAVAAAWFSLWNTGVLGPWPAALLAAAIVIAMAFYASRTVSAQNLLSKLHVRRSK